MSYFTLIAPACLLLIGAAFLLSYRLVHRQGYIKYFGLSYLLSALPLALQSISSNQVIAQTAVITGPTYLLASWFSVKAFTLRNNVTQYRHVALMMGAIATSLLAYFSFIDDQLLTRLIVINTALAMMTLLGIHACFSDARKDDPLNRWITWTYIALFIVSCARPLVGAVLIWNDNTVVLSQSGYWQLALGGSLLVGLWFACLLFASLLFDVATRARDDSERDALTTLLNRRGLYQRITQLLNDNDSRPLFMVLADVDHFKAINDRYGHVIGDAVLSTIASTIKQQLRNNDVIARYGGEEFLAVIRCNDEHEAKMVTERIRVAIQQLHIADVNIPISASFGLATFDPSLPLEDNIHRADKHLYRAKAAGRNRVCSEPPKKSPQ